MFNAGNDSIVKFKNRKILVGSVGITGYASSAILLNELWYKNYRAENFHFFNDSKEWFQVDKLGHAYTCYHLGEIGTNSLKWSGIKEDKAIWLGGLSGVAYMSLVEAMDGYSKGWGFSWADMGFNVAGSALYITQCKFWKDQKIRMKFSYYPSEYTKWRPDVLGDNDLQKLFKDYNAQTYWLSFNVHSFLNKESKFPNWLNVAVGAGARGMTGGKSNPEIKDEKGNSIVFERQRQIYLSLDADLSKIKVKSKIMKKLLQTVNLIKIPFPCIALYGNKLYFPIH